MGYVNVKRNWRDTVYIVGGGPSLIGFNFQQLQKRIVLAVNDAMLRLPWATAVFSADRDWANNRASELAQFNGERYLATGTLQPDIPGVQYLARAEDRGLSEHPGFIRGCSSGYGAFNLAFLKGAARIVLLGFDYKTPKQRWYNEDYPWPNDPDPAEYNSWAAEFETALPQLNRTGVRVLNASPESAITAFPKIALADLFRKGNPQ